MNALIVGNGQVGRALAQLSSSLGDNTSFFTSKDDRSQFVARAQEHDLVYLATRSDTGEIALGYALDALSIGKPVVTCEKGSGAYHYDKLKPHLNSIGCTASVGGASGALSLFLFPHLGLKKITGVFNGTLNFLFSECAKGRDPYEVLAEAQQLGLCEPGNNSLADVVNGELQDLTFKTAIVANHAGMLDKVIRANEFGNLFVSENEVLRQLAHRSLRFVVSIGTEPDPAMADSLYNCFHIRKDSWHIEIGLAHMSLLPFHPFPQGPQNSMVIEDWAGSTQIWGIGAGPKPTAATMIGDARLLVA